MRIGFDARWYNDSGVGTYVAELLKELVPLQNASGRRADFELVIYEDPENPVPGLPGNSVARVPLPAGKYSLLGQIELIELCRQERLDVFHSPFYAMPLRISCPVVVTFHDLIPFLFRTGNPLKQFLIKSGYRVAAARAREIIAVSGHTAQDIAKILKVPSKKISVIHNAVSREHFHAQRSADEVALLAQRYGIRSPYVVVASAWNWRTKNLANALQVLALARKQSRAQLQTVVYGPSDGLQVAGGQDAWKELNLVQTGHLPAADLARLFRYAHVFLMPSLYEGFGLPLLEAMACGCAVITSNAGSLPEVAGPGAQLFDPLDVNGMEGAVARLMCDPAELKRWQERAIQRAADFSWAKAARETVSVYHRAIGSVQMADSQNQDPGRR